MLIKATALVAIFLVSAATSGSELYKWTDENGQVHYDNSIPKSQKRAADKLILKDTTVPDAQHQDTKSRLARDKEHLMRKLKPVETSRSSSEGKEISITGKDTPQTDQDTSQTVPDTPQSVQNNSPADEKKSKCEAYKASVACFGPYRTVNGGIKAEAFQHCTEVKQPDQCY